MVNWIKIIIALGALGSVGLFLVTFYRGYWRSKRKRERKVSKNMLKVIIHMKSEIKDFGKPTFRNPEWKEAKKVCEDYESIRNFEEKIKRYIKVHKATVDYIKSKISMLSYQYHPNLTKEFKKSKPLPQLLERKLRKSILKGEKINRQKVMEVNLEFYEIIQEVRNERVNSLLDEIDRFTRNGSWILEEFREERKSLLDYLEKAYEKYEDYEDIFSFLTPLYR